ncbi:MAG: hypothetical protein M1822_002367 [Bathelium mastoideum]|nr:MAG: hypothetical protein M1822_002367 [Bathelium mastoideum]
MGGNGFFGSCPTLYDDYVPVLAFPTAVPLLQPGWSNCGPVYDGNILTDPPYALKPYAAAVTPTLSFTSFATTAAPAPPPITNPPAPTQQPSSLTRPVSAQLPPPSNSRNPSTSALPADPKPSKISQNDPQPSTGSSSHPNFNGGGSKREQPTKGSESNPQDPGLPNVASLGLASDGASQHASGQPNPVAQPPPNAGAGSQPTRQGQDPRPAKEGGDSHSAAQEVESDPAVSPSQPHSQNSQPAAAIAAVLGLETSTTGKENNADEVAAIFAAKGTTYTAFRASGPSKGEGAIVVDGRTFTAGATGRLDNGAAISNAGSGVVIDGSSTVAYDNLPSALGSGEVAVFTIGAQVLTATGNSDDAHVVDVDGTRISIGMPAITIGGHLVSAGSNGPVVDASSIPFHDAGYPDELASGAVFSGSDGALITAFAVPGQKGEAVLDGKTLTVGGAPTKIDGQVVSMAAGGLVVRSQTIPLTNLLQATMEIPLTAADGVVYNAFGILGSNGRAVSVDGHVLSVGGPAITLNGQVVSDAAAGLVLVSEILPLTSIPKPALVAKLTDLDGIVYTAFEISGAGGEMISIDDHTLSIGGPAVTLHDQIISDGPGGLVMEGSTIVALEPSTPTTIVEVTFGIGSSTITAVAEGSTVAVIDEATLSVGGPAVTIDGVVVSEVPNGVVDGDSATVPFFTTGTKITAARGANTSSSQVETGDAESIKLRKKLWSFWASSCTAWMAEFLFF